MASILTLLAIALLFAACSTKQNTARSRAWQSFTARYNTFFNGHESYKLGMEAKEKGVSDNYTELLPFFMVGNEKSAQLGKGNFETAVTKCEKAIQLHSIKSKPKMDPAKRRTEKAKQYLARKEYNPFLKNAWLLMGQAQFQKGDYLEAASTFSYITRLYAAEPAVANEARAWLARCYAGLDWFYDAEDVLAKMSRDSLSRRTLRERDATMADLLLRQKRYEDAIPYIEKAVRQSKGGIQRARRYFLLGQVQQLLGRNGDAYRSFSKCIAQSPPYQLAFNARILRTEVMGEGRGKSQLQQLRRMARSEKNKEYLDQVYYAIGNVYLAQADTASAINAYETGRQKATRNGVEKGVLLLRLGQIYWDQRRFDKAQGCYSEAINLIDRSRSDYNEMMRRSKILDKLVPYTSAVFLQDSLQSLADMSEEDRNAAIDRVIEALVKKEKEEARARKDSAANARASEMGLTDEGPEDVTARRRPGANQGQSQTWYFYDPMLVAQGKEDFRKRWGSRKNEDNWRRANKTVIQMSEDEGYDYEAEDSLQALQDSLAMAEGAAESDSVLSEDNDPHKRAYYLKQIPFTTDQREASNLIIMDGLYNAGIIEKDELEDFPLAEETFLRLTRQYPTYENRADALYQLFLLYSRWGRTADADRCRDLMAEEFPDSSMTKRVLDPNYFTMARFARQMEDSLYAATYNAYLTHQVEAVETNYQYSSQHYPTGLNRPKFIFLHALSRIGRIDGKDIAQELRDLVREYPESDVSKLAGTIVNGLDSGRSFAGTGYNPGSLWDQRSQMADSIADGDTESATLSAERETSFVILIAAPRDSIDIDHLLYGIAHYNFTNFYIRSFEMEKVVDTHLTQLRIKGFRSYDEAHAYAQEIYALPNIAEDLNHARTFLLSAHNLALIGKRYSFEDYQTFFDENFSQITPEPNITLDDAPPSKENYADEPEHIYPLKVKEPEKTTEGTPVVTETPAETSETPTAPTTPADADDEKEPATPTDSEGEETYDDEPQVNPLLPSRTDDVEDTEDVMDDEEADEDVEEEDEAEEAEEYEEDTEGSDIPEDTDDTEDSEDSEDNEDSDKNEDSEDSE